MSKLGVALKKGCSKLIRCCIPPKGVIAPCLSLQYTSTASPQNALVSLQSTPPPDGFISTFGSRPLRHCLVYQGGSVFVQQFYLSFFDVDKFVYLSRLAIKEVDDLGLFAK